MASSSGEGCTQSRTTAGYRISVSHSLLRILCAAVISAAGVSGCSISDRTSFEDDSGRIPETFFSDIRRGKTSKEWIEAQLGTPQGLQQGPGSKQIYTYRIVRSQQKHADLLIVLRYDGVYRDVEYFHIFFENDIVERHWRDALPMVQTARYFGEPATRLAEMEAAEPPETAMANTAMPSDDFGATQSPEASPQEAPDTGGMGDSASPGSSADPMTPEQMLEQKKNQYQFNL